MPADGRVIEVLPLVVVRVELRISRVGAALLHASESDPTWNVPRLHTMEASHGSNALVYEKHSLRSSIAIKLRAIMRQGKRHNSSANDLVDPVTVVLVPRPDVSLVEAVHINLNKSDVSLVEPWFQKTPKSGQAGLSLP